MEFAGLPIARFEPVSTVLNQEIVDVRAELFGRASEILIDVVEGRIEYVRIALADGQASTNRTLVVLWSAIRDSADVTYPWCINASSVLLGTLAVRQGLRKSIN